MSAENFNTLKKGPLAPIDPPPEFQVSSHIFAYSFCKSYGHVFIFKSYWIFLYVICQQDSPQTTLLRSPVVQNFSLKLAKTIILSAIQLYTSTIPLFHTIDKPMESAKQRKLHSDINEFGRNIRSYDIYASDSILNRHINNIYDLPCDDDNDYSNESLDALTISYYDNINLVHTKGKLPSDTCSKTPSKLTASHTRDAIKTNILILAQASEIHDYDLYYSSDRRSATESGSSTTYQKRKTSVLYSPLHYHPGSNLSTGNRPNSRNSLNSRLSISHNSLSIQTSNKADDSIFITQAMSHDALIGREISDFYNVPIDSDIYALPIDVIRPNRKTANVITTDLIPSTSKNFRGRLKYMRNGKKRKRQQQRAGLDAGAVVVGQTSNKLSKTRLRGDKRHSVPENNIEPMHMTLDEVKKFYTSIYSSSSETSRDINSSRNYNINHDHKAIMKGSTVNDVNSITVSTTATNNNVRNYNNNNIISNNNCKSSSIATTPNTNISNSASMFSATLGKIAQSKNFGKQKMTVSASDDCYTMQTVQKKSQFNLNLKQKFCSIFRFRKAVDHGAGTTRCVPSINNELETQMEDGKNVKFSKRALPPLPLRGKLTKIRIIYY